MSTASHATQSPLVISRPSDDGKELRSGFNMQMLSPILVGLAAPFAAMTWLFPQSQSSGRIVAVMLLLIFVVAAILLILSVFTPKSMSMVIVHQEQRMLEVISKSPFATAREMVPFADVASVAIVRSFDDDGYPSPIGELTLRNGDRLALPQGVEEAKLVALRESIRGR